MSEPLNLMVETVGDLIGLARGLCDGCPPDNEYVRGQAELICELIGLPMEPGRDLVVAAIADHTVKVDGVRKLA